MEKKKLNKKIGKVAEVVPEHVEGLSKPPFGIEFDAPEMILSFQGRMHWHSYFYPGTGRFTVIVV